MSDPQWPTELNPTWYLGDEPCRKLRKLAEELYAEAQVDDPWPGDEYPAEGSVLRGVTETAKVR